MRRKISKKIKTLFSAAPDTPAQNFSTQKFPQNPPKSEKPKNPWNSTPDDEFGDLLPDESLEHKIVHHGKRLYFFTLLTAPCGYLIRMMLADQISVAEIGVIYSALGVISVLANYNDLGLTEALQFFIPKYRAQKKYNEIKTIRIFTLLAQLASGILIGGALRFGADRLASRYFKTPVAVPVLKIFATYFLILNFLQAFQSALRSFQKIATSNALDSIRLFSVMLITGFFRFSNSLTISRATAARVIGITISTIAAAFFSHKFFAKLRKKSKISREKSTLKKQIHYAGRVFLGANANILLAQSDLQMSTFFLGPEQAGIYSFFQSYLTISIVLLSPLFTLIFPVGAQLLHQKKSDDLKKFWDFFIEFAMFGFGALRITLIATIQRRSPTFFGTQFDPAKNLFIFFSIFSFLQLIHAINFHFLAATGRARTRTRILFEAIFINVALNAFFLTQTSRALAGIISSSILARIRIRIRCTATLRDHLDTRSATRKIGKNFLWIFLSGILLRLGLFPHRARIAISAVGLISLNVSLLQKRKSRILFLKK